MIYHTKHERIYYLKRDSFLHLAEIKSLNRLIFIGEKTRQTVAVTTNTMALVAAGAKMNRHQIESFAYRKPKKSCSNGEILQQRGQSASVPKKMTRLSWVQAKKTASTNYCKICQTLSARASRTIHCPFRKTSTKILFSQYLASTVENVHP